MILVAVALQAGFLVQNTLTTLTKLFFGTKHLLDLYFTPTLYYLFSFLLLKDIRIAPPASEAPRGKANTIPAYPSTYGTTLLEASGMPPWLGFCFAHLLKALV